MEVAKKEFIPQKYERYIAGLAGIILGIILSTAVYAIVYQSSNVVNYQGTSIQTSSTSVTNAVMAKSVDASANPVNITSQFNSKTDKSIYMVLTLKNAKTTDKLTYVRYFNGNYIDSEQANPSTNGVTQFYFNWNKSGTLGYPTGIYLIKVYVNGVLATAISYSVV